MANDLGTMKRRNKRCFEGLCHSFETWRTAVGSMGRVIMWKVSFLAVSLGDLERKE